MKRSSYMIAISAMLLVLMMLLMAAGCGDSGPTAAAEDFMEAAKSKDCDKMVEYMDLSAPEFEELGVTKEALVESCKSDAEAGGEIKSYKITEETVDGDTATVKVEVTTEENGEESTDTTSFSMTKRDGEWKIGFGF